MTGSFSGSGKTPFLPAHSISKLKIRRGATLDHSPQKTIEKKLFINKSVSKATTQEMPDGNGQLEQEQKEALGETLLSMFILISIIQWYLREHG